MTRVKIVVEGQTEESFVNNVLAPELWSRQIYLTPILLGVPGHKGGRPNYARVKKDILSNLKQDQTAYCSTMLDFYGLGEGFPGTPAPDNLSSIEKVDHIERAIKADICAQIPSLRPDIRFLPYIQLHEYEALLFSSPAALAAAISQPHLAIRFQQIRDEFKTPEDINDDRENCPIDARTQSPSALSKGVTRNTRGTSSRNRFNAGSVSTFPLLDGEPRGISARVT